MSAVVSSMAYTAASSLLSLPTSNDGFGIAGMDETSISRSCAGAILQLHPVAFAHCVSAVGSFIVSGACMNVCELLDQELSIVNGIYRGTGDRFDRSGA